MMTENSSSIVSQSKSVHVLESIISDIRDGYIKIKQTDTKTFKEMQTYYKAKRYDMFVFDNSIAHRFSDIFNN